MNVRDRKKQCRRLAASKRQQAYTKVLGAMVKLCETNQSITFDSVVNESGVSKSWLYQEPGIKSLIQSCRYLSIAKKSFLSGLSSIEFS